MNIKERLTLKVELFELKRKVSNQELSIQERMTAKSRRLEIYKLLKAPITSETAQVEPQEKSLIQRFKDREFNIQSAQDFRKTMTKVYGLGLHLDEVALGMVDWFKSNQEQIA
ncbi:hypothetical protein L4174_023745 (plasmid) [Photobacterium sp. CCB-ST2H9]|uniref:hypothetical protein n=1 Tax=Photobacterium sp. CCB-ST2H9 TaxID=2912855 RepID=UPI002005BC74|nr:hypothetical protein [Photobacterium sp. CCB-ST2H9]UTM60482.1 hypothetical protein L4174_023745 [Photobacterium sp. CCB-ST2H9]